jgi:NSS family neurotransmitter:Na+ symporter
VFFTLMVLAALGSAVAVMEPLVAMLKKQAGLERFTATLIVVAVVWLMAWAVVLSFQPGQEFGWFGKRNLLGVLDTLTASLLLPLVALLITLLVGWSLRPEILRLTLTRESPLFFSLWRFLLRYIAPLAIVLMILAPHLWPA